MKRILALFAICMSVLFSQSAEAARAYFDGTYQSLGTFCPISGTAVTALQTNAGYYTDPSEPYPKTGDIAYVRAVGNNVSPCTNDTVGFEFFLPDGASLAISANFPVYCYRGKLDGTVFENVPNASGSACSQTASQGVNGGLFFGYSVLAPSWYLDIRIPVVFNKKLLGLAGPQSHRLSVATSSVFGTAFPNQPVTVFYQATMQNLSSSGVTSNSANLAFNLNSYFNGGLLYIDYGTTASFGSSLPASSVPNTSLSFPITASLAGLIASTHITGGLDLSRPTALSTALRRPLPLEQRLQLY